jgi:choloylglycine hydrolase
MRSRAGGAAALWVIAWLFAVQAAACTTFVIRDGDRAVFGKNLDWIAGDGLVIVNQRGLAKEAFPGRRGEPARWIPKYGSVTFNQVGKELPYGGINEAGLVVEQMMLNESVYPVPDARPTMSVCQWIQYQLDNFATVEEVIASDSLVRISPASTPLHFLVLDAAGGAATVEFLEGGMVYHMGDDLPVEVLANSTYAESISCLRRGDGAGRNSSLRRFLDAAYMIDEFEAAEGNPVVEYAFKVLERVDQGDFTRWSIVYDVANMRVYFRTLESPRVKYIDAAELDYGCGSRRVALDMHAAAEGPVNDLFVDYTAEMNLDVILRTFKNFAEHGFLDASESYLMELSTYPDEFECADD